MCLRIKRFEPYNHSGIGYKILNRTNSKTYFKSLYQYTPWYKGYLKALDRYGMAVGRVIADADLLNEEQVYGIHVYPSLKDAQGAFEREARDFNNQVVLVKVKVKGFIVAGIHIHCSDYADGKRGECWKEAQVVEVLDFKKRLQIQDIKAGSIFNDLTWRI